MSACRAFSSASRVSPAAACFGAASMALFVGLALAYFDMQIMAERRLALSVPPPQPVDIAALAAGELNEDGQEAVVLARPVMPLSPGASEDEHGLFALTTATADMPVLDGTNVGVAILPAGAVELRKALADAMATGSVITLHGEVQKSPSAIATARAALADAGLARPGDPVVIRPYVPNRQAALSQPVYHTWRGPAFGAFVVFGVAGGLLYRSGWGPVRWISCADDDREHQESAERLEGRDRFAPLTSDRGTRFSGWLARFPLAMTKAIATGITTWLRSGRPNGGRNRP